VDGWSDYRYWRRERGWKFTKATQPLNDQTLNAEIYRIREWYSNYLLPKQLVSFVPTLKTVRIDEETRDQSNPPFSPEDYQSMYLGLNDWSQKDRRKEYKEKGTRTLNRYWRMCFRHYFHYDTKRATDALATGRGQLKRATGTDWMRYSCVNDSRGN
jgi:hypothetical protein